MVLEIKEKLQVKYQATKSQKWGWNKRCKYWQVERSDDGQ
jgi:hypothetical protein